MNAGYTQMFTFSYCKIKLMKLEPVCEFIQTLSQAKGIVAEKFSIRFAILLNTARNYKVLITVQRTTRYYKELQDTFKRSTK